jgi:hypothetical protein
MTTKTEAGKLDMFTDDDFEIDDTFNGWTFDPADQNWFATIEGGTRTLLWLTDFDTPPTMTPAQFTE